MKKFTEDDLKRIINHQMELNWYDIDFDWLVAKYWKESSEWLLDYTTTTEKEEEFIDWLKDYLKPFVPKSRVTKEAWNILINYWLSVRDQDI